MGAWADVTSSRPYEYLRGLDYTFWTVDQTRQTSSGARAVKQAAEPSTAPAKSSQDPTPEIQTDDTYQLLENSGDNDLQFSTSKVQLSLPVYSCKGSYNPNVRHWVGDEQFANFVPQYLYPVLWGFPSQLTRSKVQHTWTQQTLIIVDFNMNGYEWQWMRTNAHQQRNTSVGSSQHVAPSPCNSKFSILDESLCAV